MIGRARTKPSSFEKFCTIGSALTVAQRAFTAVAYDDVDPIDLPDELREKAREIFGDVDRVPAECRRVVSMNKGRGVGGTRLAAEQATRLALTRPITRADATETVYVLPGGPKARHGRIGLGFARTSAKHHGARFIDDSKDGFTIVRADGRRVRFEAFAASRGGDNVRGVHIVAAVLTEAAFYYDESTGVSNGEQIFGAIIPRLLPGGQIIIESTPWAEGSGLHWREFSTNFGKPTTALAANCPTALMRDDAETLAMVEQEYQRDRDNADRELGAKFLPTGSGYFFDAFAITQCERAELPIDLPPVFGPAGDGWVTVAAFDPAYVSDACEGVIVRAKAGVFEVVATFTRVPAKEQPLVPSVVDKAFGDFCKQRRVHSIATDQHYVHSVFEHLRPFNFRLFESPSGNAGKVAVFGAARELIHAGKVRWSAGHRRLTQQMRDVVAKPLPGGLVSISSPRRRGNHGDGASALCLALWLAKRATAAPVDYVQEFERERVGVQSVRTGFAPGSRHDAGRSWR